MANHSAFCEHGKEAYSYQTCIRTALPNGTWVLNITKYSKTTSRHQNEAFHWCDDRKPIFYVNNVVRGASAQELRERAIRLCEHIEQVPQILSDNSVVYDCAMCGEPLVKVKDQYVPVRFSALWPCHA